MDEWGPADWWVIGGVAGSLLGIAFALFIAWSDTAGDILSDDTAEYVKKLHEDRRNWEPYRPPTKGGTRVDS